MGPGLSRHGHFATFAASMASTYELFEKAEQLELASAEIYGALAVRFQGDAEACALFRRLAAEEVQHAHRVRLLARRYRHDRRALGAVAPGGPDYDALLAEAREVVRRIAAGAWGADVSGLKGELADLEARFAAAHAHVLAQHADPALRRFFEELARQDAAHRALLLLP